MTGIGKPSISQYLSGKNIPREKVKQQIADALDVSVEFLEHEPSDADTEPDIAICNLSTDIAAKMLGKPPQFIRMGLQQGTAKFGFAVKGAGGKFSYHISPKRFYEYIGGKAQ
jgi:transcriptional regulator with XRE-family HTH domain